MFNYPTSKCLYINPIIMIKVALYWWQHKIHPYQPLGFTWFTRLNPNPTPIPIPIQLLWDWFINVYKNLLLQGPRFILSNIHGMLKLCSVSSIYLDGRIFLFCQLILYWQTCRQNQANLVVKCGDILQSFFKICSKMFWKNVCKISQHLTTKFAWFCLHVCQYRIRWQNKKSAHLVSLVSHRNTSLGSICIYRIFSLKSTR